MAEGPPPTYQGSSNPLHVHADSISVTPMPPPSTGPAYQGQSRGMTATDKSPGSFDSSALQAPIGAVGVAYYEGQSAAIHVFGEEGGTPPPPPGSCIVALETWTQQLDSAPYDRMPPSHENVPVNPASLLLFVSGHSSAGVSGGALSILATFDRYPQFFASGGHVIQTPTPPGAYEVYGVVGDVLLDTTVSPYYYAYYRPPQYASGAPQTEEAGFEKASMTLNGEVDPNEFRLSVNIGVSVDFDALTDPGGSWSYGARVDALLTLKFEDGSGHHADFSFAYTLHKNEGYTGGRVHFVTYGAPSGPGQATFSAASDYTDGTGIYSESSHGGDPTTYGVQNIVAGNAIIDRSLSRGTIRFYLPGVGWFESAITKDLTGYLTGSIRVENYFYRLGFALGQGEEATHTEYVLEAPRFCGASTVPVSEESVPADATGTVTFRRQIGDPTTSLDAHICMLESGAMALEWQTHGAVSVWGGELVPYCGRAPSEIALIGTSLDNVAQAWLHWGQAFESRAGRPWSDLMARLHEAKAVVLGGDYSAMDAAYKCSSYTGGHAIILLPYFSGDRILVGDPICFNFKWVPESVLRTYGEAQGVDFYGVTSPQSVYFGCTRAWAA